MGIVLYGNRLSTYCAKVRVVLNHKSIPFEERAPPDGYGSDAYRSIVPMGTIPGLKDDGVVLSESEAIVEYLEERYPTPSMLPGDAANRAKIRSLSRIHDCWVEPQLRALYAHTRPATRDTGAVERHCQALHRRLAEFANYAQPAPFIAGSQLTLADCAWPTTFIQAELLLPVLGQRLTLPPKLEPWRQLLCEHPAIAPGLEDCANAMGVWLEQVLKADSQG